MTLYTITGALALGMNITGHNVTYTTMITGAYGTVISVFMANWTASSNTISVKSSSITTGMSSIWRGQEISGPGIQRGTLIVSYSASTGILRISKRTTSVQKKPISMSGVLTGKGGTGLYQITTQKRSGSNVLVTGKGRYWGALVPYHNGVKYFGKVVIIDLYKYAHDYSNCIKFIRQEWYDKNMILHYNGSTAGSTCIFILDLSSVSTSIVIFLIVYNLVSI
jgi:hypothetical protein